MTANHCTVAGVNVSRETKANLRKYADLLVKWNKKINLISASTVADLWSRHIVDSAQIYNLCPDAQGIWADFGSGGGFPGLVVAIIAKELNPDLKVVLVESDQRKATFLRTVIRETALSASVKTERIETLMPIGADVVSARALAELPELLGFAERHLRPDGTALFQKGAIWQKELVQARKSWSFQSEHFTSVTAPQAVILKIERIAHA
ncbi:MAG: 16S rRNA (guanine(527)-N(7))-methyltransferase RsmG [Paracoccaceae bacterium]|nr:16S rRNA (guanine(527)-N(7))-methyltransferase RsmG [Paracoccaceae bacterium]